MSSFPQPFSCLTLKDKLSLLHLFKDMASDGPASAAFCLIELDVVVSEGDLALVFLDLHWPDAYIENLALLAPNHFIL